MNQHLKLVSESVVCVSNHYWKVCGGRLYGYLNKQIGYDNYRIRNKDTDDKYILFDNPQDVTAFFLWYNIN